MHQIRTAAAIATGAVVAIGISAVAAAKDTRSHMGVLTCTTSEQAPSKMTCGFKHAKTGAEERYIGTVVQGGSSNSATGKRVLIWAVIAPDNSKIAAGALSQRYSTAAEGPLLIGQSRAIALQSEASNGNSFVTQLDLALATTPA